MSIEKMRKRKGKLGGERQRGAKRKRKGSSNIEEEGKREEVKQVEKRVEKETERKKSGEDMKKRRYE